jgi:hypothetical protein
MYTETGPRIPVPSWNLAWANFAQEWRALRRSFRYNEYRKIAVRNPPKGPVGRALYALGNGVVKVGGLMSVILYVMQWRTCVSCVHITNITKINRIAPLDLPPPKGVQPRRPAAGGEQDLHAAAAQGDPKVRGAVPEVKQPQ